MSAMPLLNDATPYRAARTAQHARGGSNDFGFYQFLPALWLGSWAQILGRAFCKQAKVGMVRDLVLVGCSLQGTNRINLPLSGYGTFGLSPNMENQLIVMHFDVESKPEVYHLHNDSIQIFQCNTVWILTLPLIAPAQLHMPDGKAGRPSTGTQQGSARHSHQPDMVTGVNGCTAGNVEWNL